MNPMHPGVSQERCYSLSANSTFGVRVVHPQRPFGYPRYTSLSY